MLRHIRYSSNFISLTKSVLETYGLIQSVLVALSASGTTVTLSFPFTIILRIPLTLSCIPFPTSYIPCLPLPWFTLLFFWSSSFSGFLRKGEQKVNFLRSCIFENIFTFTLN